MLVLTIIRETANKYFFLKVPFIFLVSSGSKDAELQLRIKSRSRFQ